MFSAQGMQIPLLSHGKPRGVDLLSSAMLTLSSQRDFLSPVPAEVKLGPFPKTAGALLCGL